MHWEHISVQPGTSATILSAPYTRGGRRKGGKRREEDGGKKEHCCCLFRVEGGWSRINQAEGNANAPSLISHPSYMAEKSSKCSWSLKISFI
jgi:hypothetical protein